MFLPFYGTDVRPPSSLLSEKTGKRLPQTGIKAAYVYVKENTVAANDPKGKLDEIRRGAIALRERIEEMRGYL